MRQTIKCVNRVRILHKICILGAHINSCAHEKVCDENQKKQRKKER